MTHSNNVDWEQIRERLQAPFEPNDVQFKVQSYKKNPGGGLDKTRGMAIPYIDARNVQDRLDEAVGAGNWEFTFVPLVFRPNANNPEKGNEMSVCQGRITIHGVTKEDIGDAGDTEATKASVSDALKRTAIQWGIGRYLYAVKLPKGGWVDLDEWGKITDVDKSKFRRSMRGQVIGGESQDEGTYRDEGARDDTANEPAAPAAARHSRRSQAAAGGAGITGAQRGKILGLTNQAFGREQHTELAKMIDKPIEQLTKGEASTLIDRLLALVANSNQPAPAGRRSRACDADTNRPIPAPRPEAVTCEIATQGQRTLLTTLAREQFGSKWQQGLASMGIPDLANAPQEKALSVMSLLQNFRPTAMQGQPAERNW